MKPPFPWLALGLLAPWIGSCAVQAPKAPPSGMASIDARWAGARSDRIDGSRLVAINEQPAASRRSELSPGRNRVRVGFDWPQGPMQEVDLEFHATPGTSYVVYYDVYPPYVNRLRQSVPVDHALREVGELAAESGEGAFLFIPPLVVLGGASAATRVRNEVREHSRPAEWVDVMIVAQGSPEGVVRRVRAYPDGRTDARPWAAHAQVSAP